MRILLIEDDPALGAALRHALVRAGYVVDWVRRGDDGAAMAIDGDHDVALIDLGLPELDGIEVVRAIRARRSAYLPVIVITARDRSAHRVAGLDAGADDYVVKPFDVDELTARIRSQLRRRDDRRSNVITAGAVDLDLAGSTVRLHGAPVAMSAREVKVLTQLMRRQGRFVTKDELAAAIHDDSVEVESNTVEAAISVIRKKLGREVIVTARGLGYMVPK